MKRLASSTRTGFWIAALCVLVAGCAADVRDVPFADVPAVPGLTPYEGQQEVPLDTLASAIRAVLVEEEVQIRYYWNPAPDDWESIIASYQAVLDPEAWAFSGSDSSRGLARWEYRPPRGAQRLALAAFPVGEEAQIVVLVLGTR